MRDNSSNNSFPNSIPFHLPSHFEGEGEEEGERCGLKLIFLKKFKIWSQLDNKMRHVIYT